MSRRGSIRWHLFQVQLVGIVPLGLFAGVMLYLHWQVQEEERRQSQIETVRLLAAAVENSLDSTTARLGIFARLWSSSPTSEEAIYQQAKAALAVNEDWSNIVAFDAGGRGVFRADAAFGAPVPRSVAFDVWRPVFREKRPVISDVLSNVERTSHVVALGVPVVIGGNVAYVLVAALDLDWYDELLTKQGQPEGAVSALLDRNFKFVARSSEGDARRGGDPTPAFVDDMKVAREGLGRYVNLNGTPVYTAWTFTRHGWGVGFGTPSAPVDSAFWRYLMLLGAVLAGATGVAMLYAFLKARPIVASLESLEAQAKHLAAGGEIKGLPDSRVEEVSRALTALERASRLLQSAMRERDRSLETEREARAAAEAANHAKDEFLAMLGHELRNPLAAITNAVNIVRSKRRTADQLDFATDVIERQSRHLKRLIDDLLDVGRAMTGKILLERRPLELGACARHVIDTLRGSGRLDGRHVHLEADRAWVEADHTRLEQVLINLLQNAARHTAAGGRIDVEVMREEGTAVLRVIDDGEGIVADDLDRVFDLFFQAEPSADRSAGGLGVGLTLVQRIVALHGGQVSAESHGRGRGAAFTVRLPIIQAPGVAGTQARRPVASRRGGEKVLVVEDNADARESLALALELEGWEVLRAGTGADALELARRERPRLALLDVGLPGMDGYELAQRMRGELSHDVHLIAVTGYGTRRDTRRAAEAGFDRHLTKPVDVKELAEVLADVMLKAEASDGRSRPR